MKLDKEIILLGIGIIAIGKSPAMIYHGDDAAPYILIIGLICFGLGLILGKKRRESD